MQQYREIDAGLETIENQLRVESSQSLNSIEQSLDDIESAIQPSPATECAKAGGTWKQMPNACVDSCESQREEEVMCAQVMTAGCDCGQGMCWNGYTCEPI